MKVVFFDRDGTLVVDPPDERVDSEDKIKLFPDTIDALKYLADNGFAAVIITNQAGIAESRINEDEFWRLNDKILELLKPSGINILKTYMNGDGNGVVNEWRKPGPGMLLQAARDFDIDISEVYMVGDRLSDIQAAKNAGCKGGVLVNTGNVVAETPEAVYRADNLEDAVRYIVNNS